MKIDGKYLLNRKTNCKSHVLCSVIELTGNIGDTTLSKQLESWELDLSEIKHKFCLI